MLKDISGTNTNSLASPHLLSIFCILNQVPPPTPNLTESPSVQPSSSSGSKSKSGKSAKATKGTAQPNANGKASKKNGKASNLFY
jgi:hypothetical protein